MSISRASIPPSATVPVEGEAGMELLGAKHHLPAPHQPALELVQASRGDGNWPGEQFAGLARLPLPSADAMK